MKNLEVTYPELVIVGYLDTALPFFKIVLPRSRILSKNSSNSLSSDSINEGRLNPLAFDVDALVGATIMLSCVSSSPSANPSSFPKVFEEVLVPAAAESSSAALASSEDKGSNGSSETLGSFAAEFRGYNFSPAN